MPAKKTVILIISIDTECDKGPGWEIQHPIRFKSVTEGISEKLTPFFQTYAIKPTYLLSPEVIHNDESVHVLKSLKDCELGTHLHGEFVNPAPETFIDRTKTPQLAYTPEMEYEKLQKLTNAFENAFGYRPKSFRAGRFGISHHTINFLKELGYMVDSSVTPFRRIQFDDRHQVNFWGAPYYPYYPSRKNVTKKGKSGVLEVPVSTVIPRYANLPHFLQRWIGKDSALVTRILRKLVGFSGASDKLIYLRPLRAMPEELVAGAEEIIHLWNGRYPPVLNIMFHSVEVIPGASPYAATEEDVQTILNSLEVLLTQLKLNYDTISLGLSDLVGFL